jgi:hypothetical protein
MVTGRETHVQLTVRRLPFSPHGTQTGRELASLRQTRRLLLVAAAGPVAPTAVPAPLATACHLSTWLLLQCACIYSVQLKSSDSRSEG